jgi:hypothetical protein
MYVISLRVCQVEAVGLNKKESRLPRLDTNNNLLF